MRQLRQRVVKALLSLGVAVGWVGDQAERLLAIIALVVVIVQILRVLAVLP